MRELYRLKTYSSFDFPFLFFFIKSGILNENPKKIHLQPKYAPILGVALGAKLMLCLPSPISPFRLYRSCQKLCSTMNVRLYLLGEI